MKKWISMALLVVCLVPLAFVQAFAEAAPAPTEIVLEKPLVLPDLMDFTIKSTSFSKSEKYYGDSGNYATYVAGENYRFFLVKCELLNTSLNYYIYSDHIKNVKIVFKDKFEYEAILLQNFPEKKYPTEKLWEIESLVSTTPIFFFKVPKMIEGTLDPIMLYFTLDDVNYACKLR